jgi:hypothetical protein
MGGLIKAVSTNLCAENVAKRINHKEYQILNNGLKCTIHPQSCLYGNIGDLPEYVSFEEILILNDKNYLITISSFDPNTVIQQEICRYDYKVIKKIGCKDMEKVDDICKKLSEWKDLDTQLRNAKKAYASKVPNGKHKVTTEEENFIFKKKKKTKRTLTLLD